MIANCTQVMDFYDNNEIVDKWTSELLQDYNSEYRPRTAAHKSQIAFGRTTTPKEVTNSRDRVQMMRPKTTMSTATKTRESLISPTKCQQERNNSNNEYLNRISGSQSKVRGTQMLNFKIDLSKAREKRERQIQYSKEIRSGANSIHSREIDSVTRIVVQSFRNLIDCERCALFLMDESTNELYFKPVGDSDHSHARLKEIRFPASAGVAGWVATNKMMLNIKNAYKDARFNSDIDKKTGFRTRTILCHPVLSSSNRLLGVIQMVNKKKSKPQQLKGKANKKGYQSSFEHFSTNDEEILGKCCVEVSKSLQEIFAHRDRKLNEAAKSDSGQSKVVVVDEEGLSPLQSRIRPSVIIKPSGGSASKPQSIGEASEAVSGDQSTTEDDSTAGYIPEPPPTRRRDSTRRRSSIGDLSQFVKRNSINSDLPESIHDVNSATHSKGIAEAVLKFKYRAEDSARLQKREIERRMSDPKFLLAQNKRDRMMEFSKQKRHSVDVT